MLRFALEEHTILCCRGNL